MLPKLFLIYLANPLRTNLPMQLTQRGVVLLLRFLVLHRVSPQRILDDDGFDRHPTDMDPDSAVADRVMFGELEGWRGYDSCRGEHILETGSVVFVVLLLLVFQVHREGMGNEFVHIGGRCVPLPLLPFAIAIGDKIGRQGSRGFRINSALVWEDSRSDAIVSRCCGASPLV